MHLRESEPDRAALGKVHTASGSRAKPFVFWSLPKRDLTQEAWGGERVSQMLLGQGLEL